MFRQRLSGFAAPKSELLFLYNWHCTYSTNGAGMIRCCLDIFATQKASVISYPRWPFMRAMRPVAEWRSFCSTGGLPHQTREPWHLSCHGGKTPANLLSLERPAPYGRGVGCRGSPPAASHEARCRMAAFPVQLAVYHARPASRGTRRATAVKPRPTVMSPYAPARLRRAVRGAGALPLPRRRAWSGRIGRRFEGWGQ